LLPSLEFGGLLKEGATLADFDEPPVLLQVNARHPIWRATENGKKVVLKEYLLSDSASRSGFKRELRALQRLQHPAIVQLLAVIIEPTGRAYVQMPSYECTLAEWAARGRHSEQRLQQVLSELTRALEHVHSQAMLHGDLKAENVFIDTQAGHPHPRLGDFDLSQDTSGRSLSLSRTASSIAGGPTGTLGYLAPELLAGQPATFASDVYALGRTMYFVHFQAQQGSAAALPGDVVIPAHSNRDLMQLLRALLNADPKKRPTAAQAASAPYFTTSLLVEKEEAAALREALQAELTATRSTQQRLEEETQAFVAKQRAFNSMEEQLRAEQADFSKLSQEQKAALAGEADALKEREAQLQQTRAQLLGERTELQEGRKRQAEAEAALNERQTEFAALWEALSEELAAARSMQQGLEKETQAFVAKQRALNSMEEQLRAEQADFGKLSQEQKATLAGEADALKEREAQLQKVRGLLSGERSKLQDECKRQAEAEAALNEKQAELRASIALLQKPPMYWSSALTATASSQYDVTSEMRTRMQGIVDNSCKSFGVGRDIRTKWAPYNSLRIKKVPTDTDTHMQAGCTHARTR
jgi:hypothetical protein